MTGSRISGFYKQSVQERLRLLHKNGSITDEDLRQLRSGMAVLNADQADKMIENVIGVFGLPIGIGLNFIVNSKEYLIPMVVEEPSIIAAVSAAAKKAAETGGFISESNGSVLIGQIQVVDFKNISRAKQAILQNKDEIINLANSLHPNMAARGGGAKDLEVRILSKASARGDMLILHLLVDVKDAMGANLVNSMCEGVASLVEKITGGKVFLRILSNLADRSIVRSRCVIPIHLLAGNGFSGEEVRDGIILANDFALADPYRAATHNKGIMNGIDPVIIATGNDWRAAEAAAHAYAARGGKYAALTKWSKNEDGNLAGNIEIPIRVGIVGGPLESNPAVATAMRLLNVISAKELAEVLGAVGLAQNLSALRALASEGIQQGHMSLHARSVTMAAGARSDIFEEVVEKVIASSEIKVWKAKEIIEEVEKQEKSGPSDLYIQPAAENLPSGYGKIIMFGEHAVVYGRRAIAAPLPLAMQAAAFDSDHEGIHLIISRWGVDEYLRKGTKHKYSIFQSLDMILDKLNLHNQNMQLEVYPHVPRAMGLGGSAALAVAIIRALSEKYKLKLSNEKISSLAFASETIVHGNASGIDNTLAVYGKFIRFKKGNPPELKFIKPQKPIRIVIGQTWVESLTAKMVTKVNDAWKRNKMLYEDLFTKIDQLTVQAEAAVEKGSMEELGELMNINQGYLNALQVSSREIEELVHIARSNGALGAKLTGGGGGGAIIALCPDNAEEVALAIRSAGFKAMITDIH